LSVPIYDYEVTNEELASKAAEDYYTCCGKSICGGCIYSFRMSGNNEKCPFCKGVNIRTDGERVEEIMRRVEANDAGAIYLLGNNYHHGQLGLLQDRVRAMELWKQAAALGSSKAHYHLVCTTVKGGILRSPNFTTRPRLWQGMKWQGSILDAWRHSPEIWDEL
jgi:TPR repeat protein